MFFFQCVNDDEIDDNIPIIKKNVVPEVSKVNHLSALKIAFDSGKKILGQYGNRSGRGKYERLVAEVQLKIDAHKKSYVFLSIGDLTYPT